MEGVRNPADLSVVEADIAEIAADIAALVVDIADLETDIAALQNDVTDIKATTDGLPTLSETGGTLTTDGTEQNIYINNTPLGIFRPVCVKVDFTDHTAGETVVIRVYYRLRAAGAMILQSETTYAGVLDPPLLDITLEPNRFGVQVTIERTAGVARDYDWEVFYEL